MKKADLTNDNKNSINMNMTMKIKYNIIAFVVILLLLGGVSTTRAQGIYSADTNELNVKTDKTEDTQSSGNSGGLFRDGGWGDEGPVGGGGSTDEPDPTGGEPIGEGLLILSLLSGAYVLVKRKVKRKHES